MTKAILDIILTGGLIFSEERRRHYSSKLEELSNEVDKEKGKVFPEYCDARIAIAEKKLDNFMEAFAKEFKAGITELLAKVAGDE